MMLDMGPMRLTKRDLWPLVAGCVAIAAAATAAIGAMLWVLR